MMRAGVCARAHAHLLSGGGMDVVIFRWNKMFRRFQFHAEFPTVCLIASNFSIIYASVMDRIAEVIYSALALLFFFADIVDISGVIVCQSAGGSEAVYSP